MKWSLSLTLGDQVAETFHYVMSQVIWSAWLHFERGSGCLTTGGVDRVSHPHALPEDVTRAASTPIDRETRRE